MGFFSLITAVFAVYSASATANYRQLRIDEVSETVAFESETVGKIIAEMERNAVDLALAGRQFYLAKERSAELGISISTENFNAFRAAVGGGIWYEPYALDADKKRVCYYAFFDEAIGEVRYEPDYETEEYDYHTQMWYTTILEGLDGSYDAVWTSIYYDDAGINALMTTVGAGIYDDERRLVGISTVDWAIQSMVDRLSTIKPTPGSFVLLASSKDDYIITKTREGSSVMTGDPLHNLSWFNDISFTDSDSVGIAYITSEDIEYISFSRLFTNGWLFTVQIPADEIISVFEKRNNQFTVIIASSFILLLILAAYLLSRMINRPLRKLSLGVAELGGGDLDKHIEMRTRDEFGTLAAAFNKMTVDLKKSIEQAAQEQAEKERIGAELNVAANIQGSMLPCTFPAFPERSEFDIYAVMQPAKEVGGDFYDFFLINKRTLGVVIADVSGKGVPAALFMVISKTLIKNTVLSGKEPEAVFETVNKMLCENNNAGMFVTAFLGCLDIPTGKFTFVNAGHNLPLLRSNGKFDWLKTQATFVLASLEDMFFSQHEITLKPGDELFLYTDGVTEAENNEKALFGNSLLLETANNNLDLPLNDFTMSINREIEKFADGAEQADDITMLVLRYKGLGLTVEAKLENMDTVQDFINAPIEGSPQKFQSQIRMVVDEIFSNIANYAYYPNTGDVTINVAVSDEAKGKSITLKFEDSGIAFDPFSSAAPDITLPVDEREIGGLGLFMVKNIVDSIDYQRTDGKNILTIKHSE